MYRLLLAELNVRHNHDHYNGIDNCTPSDPEVNGHETSSTERSTTAGVRTRARHSSEDENVHAEHRNRAHKPPIPAGRETRKSVSSTQQQPDQSPRGTPSPTCPVVVPPTPEPVMPEPPKPKAPARGPIATMRRINMQRAHQHTQDDIPKEQGHAYDDAYTEMQRLTPAQREIVKATFPAMEEDAVRNALQVLLLLFSEHPRYKNIWPQFRAIPDSALMSAVELRRHASVYMTGLRAIIDAMDDEIMLADQLKRIARAHIKWNIHKAHVMHMLLPVLEVLSKALNQRPLSTEVSEAWTTLYDVIANLIDIFREVERRASLSKGRHGSISSN